ncbi:hypothetical protein GCM10023116_22400 [Kistimonas scapharcae]|uniref:Uncharacterized protein n=1 Tax=Kistimonas scapharcae TaxID=1036133 RepID=A0ABP8V2A0_9GAMM
MERSTLALALNNQAGSDELSFLALNFQLTETSTLPEKLLLIPAETFSGLDGRAWNNPTPESVVATTRHIGRDIPIDIEHATELKGPKGEPAPTQAWIRRDNLEVIDGAIWGRVEWNDNGRQLVEGKAYRYYSLAFYWDQHGNVRSIKSVGLTSTQKPAGIPGAQSSVTSTSRKIKVTRLIPNFL